MIICVDSESGGMAGSSGPVTTCLDMGLIKVAVTISGQLYLEMRPYFGMSNFRTGRIALMPGAPCKAVTSYESASL